MNARPLFKTTMVFWSEMDPDECGANLTPQEMARAVECGDAVFTKVRIDLVDFPQEDPDFVDGDMSAQEPEYRKCGECAIDTYNVEEDECENCDHSNNLL